MRIEEGKNLDIVSYLAELGYQPTKISGAQYWYHSPLRTEKTPSFKVNRSINRWYDFAEGIGGNLIDFGIRYFQCGVADFLKKLAMSSGKISQYENHRDQSLRDDNKSSQLKIISVEPITSFPLIKYYRSRRIVDEIASRYLQQVHFQLKNKLYYALGFKNDAGGYELRNQNYKGSTTPKDITFIDNGSKDIAVFEGFFDFLSYKNMYYNQAEPMRNWMILNSTSFFEKYLPKMVQHQSVHLYLDNDKTGQKCMQKALSLDAEKFRDETGLYKNYQDLNDWLMHVGLSPRHKLGQQL